MGILKWAIFGLSKISASLLPVLLCAFLKLENDRSHVSGCVAGKGDKDVTSVTQCLTECPRILGRSRCAPGTSMWCDYMPIYHNQNLLTVSTSNWEIPSAVIALDSSHLLPKNSLSLAPCGSIQSINIPKKDRNAENNATWCYALEEKECQLTLFCP